MGFDRLRAHAEVEGDRLVRATREDAFEHAPLPRTERLHDPLYIAFTLRPRPSCVIPLMTVVERRLDQERGSAERFAGRLHLVRSLVKLFAVKLHRLHTLTKLVTQATGHRENFSSGCSR